MKLPSVALRYADVETILQVIGNSPIIARVCIAVCANATVAPR